MACVPIMNDKPNELRIEAADIVEQYKTGISFFAAISLFVERANSSSTYCNSKVVVKFVRYSIRLIWVAAWL
jgi:hypothetical protein